MKVRLLLVVLLALSSVGLTVSPAGSADEGSDDLRVELPSEFVAYQEHAIRVVVETDKQVASSEMEMIVNDETAEVVENDSEVLHASYTPKAIGELEFEFSVDVEYADGAEGKFEADHTVSHEDVLDHRLWKGVAMPVPEKFEGQVDDAAANRSLPRENQTMFWGPTTGDGTMYAILTEEQVEYGPFAMVASLATLREQRDHVVQGEFVLCFYNANYSVFYDEPAVETPSSDDVEHADVVAYDLEVEEVEDGFYAYRGDGTDDTVVFVDHSGVLDGRPSGDVIRGAVVDVPFAHGFYPSQYGVEADLYVYPMETVDADDVPVEGDGKEVLSGEENIEVLEAWGWGEDGGNDSGPPESGEPTRGYDDARGSGEDDSNTSPEDSNRSSPGQPQSIGVTSLMASIVSLLFLRSKT